MWPGLGLLCSLQVLSAICEEVLELFAESFNGLSLRLDINIFFKRHLGAEAAVQLEGTGFCTCILIIVVCELGHGYGLCLIVLLKFDKSLKVRFYASPFDRQSADRTQYSFFI